MDWYQAVFELIDMRSFSNLWYWIALAVVWSSASHWILGIPYDTILRARRNGGQDLADLQDLARININRMLYIGQVSGQWLLVLACFLLTALLILGFWYGYEFAQALFLLALPLSLVGGLGFNTALMIRFHPDDDAILLRSLLRHRLITQIIGLLSIFATAMWGMYMNLTYGALG